MPNTYVIYHAGCMDGFGAAWAAWRHLPGREEVRYLPAAYGEDPPAMDPGSRVYILDFSYPRETMLALIQEHRVTLLDHHETALAYIGDLPECHFDLAHSGAVIAWKHFAGEERPVPDILEYIQDRDLWKWELEQSREVSAALDALPRDFREWDRRFAGGERRRGPLVRLPAALRRLARGERAGESPVRKIAAEGAAILRANRQQVNRITANTRFRSIGGYLVPVVNTPVLISEACERLLELHPDAPFAAAWYQTRERGAKWSLRSRDGSDTDVSAVARQLGGGGHPHAAGFTGPDVAEIHRLEGEE